MADIFTIILVFLLKSFAVGSMNVTPAQGLLLPEAQAAQANFEALKVEISETAVLIEGKPVAMLEGFRFKAAELSKNGTAPALSKTFKRERERQVLIAKSNSDVKVDPKVVIIADQRAPYSTVKSVLASAAVYGYTDFKLAVVTE